MQKMDLIKCSSEGNKLMLLSYVVLKWTEFSRKELSHIKMEPRKIGLKLYSSLRLSGKDT